MTRPTQSIGWVDVAVALVFSALGVLLMAENIRDAEVDASYLSIPAFLAVTLPVLWRRAAPLHALGATLVALLVNIALFGSLVRCGVVFPLTWVLVFAAGARLGRDQSLAALGAGLAVIVAMLLSDHAVGIEVLPVVGPVTAIVWGVGRLVRSRALVAQGRQTGSEALSGAGSA